MLASFFLVELECDIFSSSDFLTAALNFLGLRLRKNHRFLLLFFSDSARPGLLEKITFLKLEKNQKKI